MRGTEMRAFGELAGRTLAGAGTMVRDLHMAVSGRAFTASIGDALVAGGSPLALTMTLRHRGADLPLEPGALARALPEAGAKVAISVRGLGETDASWRLGADAHQPGYGACPRRDLGHTPIELRYNTGLHISDNGRALAALLEELYQAWPVAIEEIVIVGHSMGGLVARVRVRTARYDLTSAVAQAVGMTQTSTVGVVPQRGVFMDPPVPPPSPFAGTGGVTPAP